MQSVKALNNICDSISVQYMGDETIIKTGILNIDPSFLGWMVETSEQLLEIMQYLSFSSAIK